MKVSLGFVTKFNGKKRILTIMIITILILSSCLPVLDPGEHSGKVITAVDRENDPGIDEHSTRSTDASTRSYLDMKINEIMLFPPSGGPWIELYNDGPDHVSINNWVITNEDELTYSIDLAKPVPPWNYVVLHFDSGESESDFGQSQPNAIHLYTGWKNVRWDRFEIDKLHYYARAAVGYDLIPGGTPEIVSNTFGGDRIYYYQLDAGTTNPWLRTDIDEPGGTYRIKIIDVDNDNITDIVYNNYFAGGNSVHWIKGPITNPVDPWGGPYDIDGVYRPEGLEAGNISGDNLTDVVVGSEADDDIFWYRCPTNFTTDPWTKYTIDNNINAPGGLKLVDIDGDSDLDLVAVASYGEEVVWYEQPTDPTGVWTRHKIAVKTLRRGADDNGGAGRESRSEFDPIGEVFVEYVDNDMMLDVVVTEPKKNRVVWYQSPPDPKNAAQIWIPHVIDDDITTPSGIDMGDFDGDGDPDLAVTSVGGFLYWYEHPEVPDVYQRQWDRFTVDDELHLAFYVNVTDLDIDGDGDLVTADQNDGKVIWYENRNVGFSTIDQCSLYTGLPSGPDNIVDFVAWGEPPGIEGQNALIAGIWQTMSFIDMLGMAYNQSMGRNRFGTDTDQADDWEVSSGVDSEIPTPGTMNYPYPTNAKPTLLYNPSVFRGATGGANVPPASLPVGVCLANYSAFTFSVNVSDPFGVSDLRDVSMVLDPGGIGIEMKWTRSDNDFSITGEKDYLELLVDECSAANNGVYDWQLNFTVMFDWRYPKQVLQDVSVSSMNGYGFGNVDVSNSVYRVVTGLNLTGELQMRSQLTENVLRTNDWVIPGENILVFGPRVVYDLNGGTYYPNDSDFDVIISVNSADQYYDHTSAGYGVSVTVEVPEPIAAYGTLNIQTAIHNRPLDQIKWMARSDELLIDSGSVSYELPSPTSSVWHTTMELVCSIKIREGLFESGVSGSTIEYRVANGSLERFGEWQKTPLAGTGEVMEPVTNHTFTEGANNWIQWRSSDLAGNGPTASPFYRVPVDTEEITFHKFYPPPFIKQYSTNLSVIITIADFGGSGVNLSTLRAAVKPAGEESYGEWFEPDYTIKEQAEPTTFALFAGPETVELLVDVPYFKNGTGNYIKFRGLDVAGNGFAGSDEYNVVVDVSRPDLVLELVSPGNGSIERNKMPILKWQQKSIPLTAAKLYNYVYLGTDRTELQELELTGNGSSSTLVAVLPVDQLQLDISSYFAEGLEPNATYYWTVIPAIDTGAGDLAFGKCGSGVWEFTVFLGTAGLTLSSEPTFVQLYAGGSASFSIRIRNIGLVTDDFTLSFTSAPGLIMKLSSSSVELAPGGINNVELTVTSVGSQEGGEYTINVTGLGLASGAEAKLDLGVAIITLSEPPPDQDGETTGTMSSWGLIILVLLIFGILVVLTIYHYIYSKRSINGKKDRVAQEPESNVNASIGKGRPVIEPLLTESDGVEKEDED